MQTITFAPEGVKTRRYNERKDYSGFSYFPLEFKRFNPSPLGLFAFAHVTFCANVVNLCFPETPLNFIIPTAIMFGGLTQFLVGILDFFVGGTFSGIVYMSFGAFWTGQGITFFPSTDINGPYANNETMQKHVNGVFNLAWAIYTYILMLFSYRLKRGSYLLTLILLLVATSYLFLAIFGFSFNRVHQRIAGAFGLTSAVFAWYKGLAEGLEEEQVNLPIGKFINAETLHNRVHNKTFGEQMRLVGSLGGFLDQGSQVVKEQPVREESQGGPQ